MTLMTSQCNLDRIRGLLPVLIFLFTSAIYLSTLSNGFVYDDNFVVMQNMLIRGSTPVSDYFFNNVWSFFDDDSKANFYRPLQLLLYRVEYGAFGLTPWPWHLVNLLFHAANTVLVFLLALKVLPSTREGIYGSEHSGSALSSITALLPALLAALIFALHPVNVEPVAWISSVSDLLFTFFFLVGFLLYIKNDAEDRAPAGAYVTALILFALALFSKETAMAFIPVIFIYDIFFRGSKIRNILKTLIPFILVALFYLIIRTYALGGITQKEIMQLSTFVAVINIFPQFFAYISKLLLPVNLSVIYEIDIVTSLFSLRILAGILLLALFIFLFCFFRKTRVIPLALALIIIPLLPILYIPVVSTGGFAERYLYLPSFGLALFLVYWFFRGLEEVVIRHQKRGEQVVRLLNLLVTLPVLVVLLLFLVSSTARMRVWKDDLTLWSDALVVSPKSAIAHYNLGTVYEKEKKYGDALWHFQNAGRLDPSYSVAFFNIGSIMGRTRRYNNAIIYFKKAIDAEPQYDEYHLSLARAYLGAGLVDRSIEVLEELLKRAPDRKDALSLLKEARSQR